MASASVQLSRLAQLVERETVNLKVVGSNPPVRVHVSFTHDTLYLEPHTASHNTWLVRPESSYLSSRGVHRFLYKIFLLYLVSIQGPLGYEPNTLPLRHRALPCFSQDHQFSIFSTSLLVLVVNLRVYIFPCVYI